MTGIGFRLYRGGVFSVSSEKSRESRIRFIRHKRTRNDDGHEKITTTELRSSLYEQYRHELDSIWRNSSFIWVFEGVIFTSYAFCLTSLINKGDIKFIYNLLSTFVAFIGLCTSTIWIAINKASKLWQEWQEDKISRLERDRDIFTFEKELAFGGGSNRLSNVDDSLLSNNSGLFSPGKINIFISQFVWFIWLLILVLHQVVVRFFIFGSINWFMVVIIAFLYLIFVGKLKSVSHNTYIRKEDYKYEFIYETYQRVEKIERKLQHTPRNREALNFFVENDYASLSWSLYKIYNAYKECNEFNLDWLLMPFESTKALFEKRYISNSLNTTAAIDEQIAALSDCLSKAKEDLRRFYEA